MLKHLSAVVVVAALLACPANAQNAGEIEKARSGQSCAGCNLFQANLSYRDGQNMDLSNARLRQANLSLVTYDDVNFSGSNLTVSNLFGARFNRCDFRNADLSRAALVGAYFGTSNLAGAKLEGTNLGGTDLSQTKGLTQAQLDASCGDSTTRLPAGLRIRACR